MIKGVNGIHHIGISVPDLAAAEHFYCDVVGLELAERYDFEPTARGDAVLKLERAAAKSVMLRAGNIYLEIFQFISPTPKERSNERPVCDHGYTHFAFDVDDIDSVYERLANGGVTWHCPIQEYTDDTEWFQNAYGRDPFGNVIEIQQLNRTTSWSTSKLPRWKEQ